MRRNVLFSSKSRQMQGLVCSHGLRVEVEQLTTMPFPAEPITQTTGVLASMLDCSPQFACRSER